MNDKRTVEWIAKQRATHQAKYPQSAIIAAKKQVKELAKALKQKGFTQIDIAFYLNCQRQTVAQKLSYKVDFTLTELEVLKTLVK